MALLLLESKRDDLLLPYFEIVKSKNPQITFGQFKSNLLEHLTQNGGLRNLSLASNYYLAGAARYYFNGDLTTNKDLALYFPYTPNSQLEAAVNNGEQVTQNHVDNWKTDICKALNKVILLLRNSYIDTIGETWEQPEDFGELPLPKLLKKYNSKISKIKSNDSEEDKDEMNLSDRVSPNYTFEIMYSYEDCQKFYEATSPGAWCITYGENHYNGYINRLNIHYVIFKRDGWENVKRIPEKDKWVEQYGVYKPQDDYGNSLIAMLQSNSNGEPIYITSRWNHGSSDCGGVEADHAYTKEEFMRITGVSNDELKRIFEIWAKNVKKRSRTASEISESFKAVVRRLKEFQMRINGGADIVDYMEKFGIGIQRTLFEGEDNSSFSPSMLKKAPFVLNIKDDGDSVYFFIMDKGKVIFESICDSSKLYDRLKNFIIPSDYESKSSRIENCIIIPTEKYFMIYNYRFHSFLDIRGDKKFKRIPIPSGNDSYNYPNMFKTFYFEVKKGMYDIALVNTQTFKPLVLPNGDVWFNEIDFARYGYHYERQNRINCHFCGSALMPVIEIVYDSSSREKYFYNCLQKKFFTPKEDHDYIPLLTDKRIEPMLTTGAWSSDGNNEVYGIEYKPYDGYYNAQCKTPPIYYDALTDEPISVNGLTHFTNLFSLDCKEPFFKLDLEEVLTQPFNPTEQMKQKLQFFRKCFGDIKQFIYDKRIKKPLAINGKILKYSETKVNNDIIFLELRSGSELVPKESFGYYNYALYDTKKHAFVKNPSGFPNSKIFSFENLHYWGEWEDGIIGYYVPNEEVKNSNERIEISPYATVHKGCIPLKLDEFTYYNTEFDDKTDEYLRLFGNEAEQPENQEIVKENIRKIVEKAVDKLLY